MPVLPVRRAPAPRQGGAAREDPRRPGAGAARRDDAKKRPAHRAADLDRRAPYRRLRRPLRPGARGWTRPATGGEPMSEAQSNAAQAATFQIEKVYVKDLSLEIPHAPQVFM